MKLIFVNVTASEGCIPHQQGDHDVSLNQGLLLTRGDALHAVIPHKPCHAVLPTMTS